MAQAEWKVSWAEAISGRKNPALYIQAEINCMRPARPMVGAGCGVELKLLRSEINVTCLDNTGW